MISVYMIINGFEILGIYDLSEYIFKNVRFHISHVTYHNINV